MANAVLFSVATSGGSETMRIGGGGSDYINSTTNIDGTVNGVTWGAITCITAATFTLLSSSNTSTNGAAPAAGNMNAVTLVAGQTIYGRFTNITLASGSIIAYRNSR